MDFSKKVVVVTGGSQGIGKEIVLAYGRANAIVNIIDINVDDANKVCHELAETGVQSHAYGVNLINRQEVTEAIGSIIKKHDHIDVLVNCAGVINTKPFLDVTDKEWDLVMNVNLRGPFFTCQEVLKPMMEQRYGKILNIASIAGKKGGGFFGNTVYGSSKAGVIGMTKGLAQEAGPYGINVNCICPGGTNTKMINELTEEERTSIINSIPLRKFAEPEDIANMALFLTSDLAGHVSGEITDVDGGAMLD